MIKSDEIMYNEDDEKRLEPETEKPETMKQRKHRRSKKSKLRKLECLNSKDAEKFPLNEEDDDEYDDEEEEKKRKCILDSLRSEQLSSECKLAAASSSSSCSSSSSTCSSSSLSNVDRGHRKRKQVFLRPTNVPLLNAPKNSTQFIIDDHENSNLFWNFHDSEDNEDLEHPHPAGLAVFPGQYFNDQDDNISPDDDTFWAEYSERDFQSVYETAHQEKIAEWSKMKLVGEISALERRHRELVDALSKVDPKIYLQKLQSELLSLQETNRLLRNRSSPSSSWPSSPSSQSISATLPDTTNPSLIDHPADATKTTGSDEDRTE